MKEHDDFFKFCSDNFETTYWIPGNHEYYHSDFEDKRGAFFEKLRDNIFLVNDYAATIENVRLIFSTLWTKVKPNHRTAIERSMNDFHLIRFNGRRLTCKDIDDEHIKSLDFIKNELLQELPGVKKIVVTHHVPTFINYPPEYFGQILNEAFAVNLTRMIVESGPDYWIYGHHHKNVPEFLIGKTKLVTNQLGYVQHNENIQFDPAKVLEL